MSGEVHSANPHETDLRFMRRARWILWSLWVVPVIAFFALIVAHSRYAFVPLALGMAIAIGWNGYFFLIRRPRMIRSQATGK